MQKFIFILLLLVAFGCGNNLTISPTTATTNYYVDFTNGNDSNPGTVSAPWKTLSKISNTSFTSASTIYFKKSEVWNETLTLNSSHLTIDSYGSGTAPEISGVATAVSTSWTNLGGGIYSQAFSLGGGEALGNIAANGSMLSFVSWNTDATTTLGSVGNDSYSYDYSLNKIFIKVASNPALDTYTYSKRLYGIDAQSLSNIIIKNITISRFSLHGIHFKDCSSCSVSTVTVDGGGGAVINVSPLLYAGNGIEFGGSSSYGVVDSSVIKNIFDSCISPQTYANNKTADNFTFSNLILDKCGLAGIELSVLSNGGSTGSQLKNVTISSSAISDMGRGWSGRRYGTAGNGINISADSGAGTLSNIQVTTTTVTHSIGDGIKISGEVGVVTLSRLKLTGNNYGTSFADSTSTSTKINLSSSLLYNNASYGFFYNSTSALGFQIYQNTFYKNGTINLGIFNQAGTAKIENNLFSSDAAMTHLYSANALVSPTVNHNCYTNLINMFGYNGSAYSSLAAFNTATGFEAAGIEGLVDLNNPNTENFNLLGTSACVAIGSSSIGVTVDYDGFLFHTIPSAGAYEL